LVTFGSTKFNDGLRLSWEIFEEPNVTKTPTRIICDDDNLMPLDEAHWNAVVFPCPTRVVMGGDDPLNDRILSRNERAAATSDRPAFLIGKSGPVTIRMLVTELHEKLRLPSSPSWADAATPADLLNLRSYYRVMFNGFTPLGHAETFGTGNMMLHWCYVTHNSAISRV
jgi:hypothetical protein